MDSARRIIAILSLGLVVAGCSEETNAGRSYRDASERMVAARAYLSAIADASDVNARPSGLLYTPIRLIDEDGAVTPRYRDEVLVHYRGLLADGVEFDSSYDRNTPARFRLRDLIAGWREGLGLMHEGDKYRFYIPPQLGYGARGFAPVVPPNAALVYEVELLEIYPALSLQDTALK